MTEQAIPEGGATPDTDANASQQVETAEAQSQPNGSEAESSPAPNEQGDSFEQKGKEPKGVQKRLDELTRNWREEQRRAERLERLLEQALGRSQAPPQQQMQPQKPKTLADFGYDESAYREYLFNEARAQAAEAAKAEASKWRDELTRQQRREAFDSRVEKFRAEVPDFDEVFTPTTPISEAMAEAMMDTEEGPAIAYYLGKNPDIAQRIYRLSPVQAGREIARIEDRIVAERKKAAEKPVSKAPPPAPRIEGTEPALTVSASDPESDKLPIRDWLKRREKELSKRK